MIMMSKFLDNEGENKYRAMVLGLRDAVRQRNQSILEDFTKQYMITDFR